MKKRAGMQTIACLVACMLLLGMSRHAHAHHAAEFFTSEGFDIGHRGEGLLNFTFDWEKYGGIDALSSELGVFYSPLPRIGLGVDVRVAEDAVGDWVYSSVTPKIVLQLSDPHRDSRFKFAISAGYQFAEDLSHQEYITTIEEVTTFVDEPVVQTVAVTEPATQPEEPTCNPLFDLDCEPSPAREPRHTGGTHSTTTTTTKTVGTQRKANTERVVTRTTTTSQADQHHGIHNHDSRLWFARFIAQTHIGKTKIVANVIGVFPEDDKGYWGYSIGARRQLFDRLAMGIEATGDFSTGSEGEHELVGAAHFAMNDRATVRLGLGAGLNDDSPDFTLRTGLIWTF